VRTIYPHNIKIKNKFKVLRKKHKIFQINKIISYTEEKDFHIITFSGNYLLKIPKSKMIIFALGGIGNLNLYKNASFINHSPKSLVGVLDHPSLYPLEFERGKKILKITSDKNNLKSRVKSKFYYTKSYGIDNKDVNLIQQGVAEFHPIYRWPGQGKKSLLINLSKRVLNNAFFRLRLNVSLKPDRFRVFMQIEQSVEKSKYVETQNYKGILITEKDVQFIKSFILELIQLLKEEGLEIFSQIEIHDDQIPTLFQAFHPSTIFHFPLKGEEFPRVNFEGRPKESSNLNFVGSCCFPTPGWVNPTLMAMAHASYVAKKLVQEIV
jgi:hypothetical protein